MPYDPLLDVQEGKIATNVGLKQYRPTWDTPSLMKPEATPRTKWRTREPEPEVAYEREICHESLGNTPDMARDRPTEPTRFDLARTHCTHTHTHKRDRYDN